MTLKIKKIIFNANIFTSAVSILALLTLTIVYKELRVASSYILIATVLILFALSVALQLFYKKSLPTEIVFFSIFTMFFTMQSYRIMGPIITFNSFIITLQIAKFTIFCKYMSLSALLGASLFSYSIKKQKIGSWILLSTLASIIISSFIHLNTGIIGGNLIGKIIYGRSEFILTILIIISVILSFIKTSFETKNRDYNSLGIASLLLSAALQLSFSSLTIVSGVITVILLIVGSVIFLKKLYSIILWS